MVVIAGTDSGLFPAELSVERDGGNIGLGDLKKNGSAGLFTNRGEQRGSHAATAESGIDGEIQNFGFVRRGLAP